MKDVVEVKWGSVSKSKRRIVTTVVLMATLLFSVTVLLLSPLMSPAIHG
jgi:hypothetical protein